MHYNPWAFVALMAIVVLFLRSPNEDPTEFAIWPNPPRLVRMLVGAPNGIVRLDRAVLIACACVWLLAGMEKATLGNDAEIGLVVACAFVLSAAVVLLIALPIMLIREMRKR